MPSRRLEAHKDGFSITTMDVEGDLVVTGGSDGGVRLFRLSSGKLLTVLSQSSCMVYQVRMDHLRVFATAGNKVTVQTIKLKEGEPESILTHLLEGHTRDVLCLDAHGDIVVTGGTDKNIMVFKLGPGGVFRVVHTLTEHKLKVSLSTKCLFQPPILRCDASKSMRTSSYLAPGTELPKFGI